MDEFALIDLLLRELGETTRGPLVSIGPGDDAAVTRVPPGAELVSTIDSLVAGIHFPPGASSELVGCRALGVAVSDLAAMGAEGGFCLIALTLPTSDADWVRDFARGVAESARRFGCTIVGGNLARGPLNIAVSAHGYVPAGTALTRSGARVGDLVAVSGDLGGAALALAHPQLLSVRRRNDIVGSGVLDDDYPLRRYYLPTPRLELGRRLRGLATSAIDVSDGLLADLGHLAECSMLAAELDVGSVPCAAGCAVERAVTAGDDYELLFTVRPERWMAVQEAAASIGEPVTVIGSMKAGRGVSAPGLATLTTHGFQHFN